MASGARFRELFTWAQDNALDAALDTPVNEMAAFIGLEPKHAALLIAAARTFEATSVRELLASSAGKALRQQWPDAWPKIARRLERWLVTAKNDRDLTDAASARAPRRQRGGGPVARRRAHLGRGQLAHRSRALRAKPPHEGARLATLATLTGSAEGTGQRFAVLAAMTRLRRLACHPRLIDDGSSVASSKLATFLELARELRDAGLEESEVE